MGIRFYKPTSPGRRFASVSDFSELTDKKATDAGTTAAARCVCECLRFGSSVW